MTEPPPTHTTPPPLLPSPAQPHLHHLSAELSEPLIRLLIATADEEGDIHTVEGGERRQSDRRWEAEKQKGRQADTRRAGGRDCVAVELSLLVASNSSFN